MKQNFKDWSNWKKNLKSDIANEKKELEYFQKQVKTKEKEQTKDEKIKTDLAKKLKERNTLEERLNSTKTLEELIEEEAELNRQNENGKIIINDENTSPDLTSKVKTGVAEREEEVARLRTQIEEREREMPLREKIKNIFKRYGFTVGAVFLAVGTTIGVIVNALTNGLKSVAKGVENGLKDLGKKIGQLLPGLIGTIVSFIFKTAGQVVDFLGKNAWSLILDVAVSWLKGLKKIEFNPLDLTQRKIRRMANAPNDAAMIRPDFKVSRFDSSFFFGFHLIPEVFFVTSEESKGSGFGFFCFHFVALGELDLKDERRVCWFLMVLHPSS